MSNFCIGQSCGDPYIARCSSTPSILALLVIHLGSAQGCLVFISLNCFDERFLPVFFSFLFLQTLFFGQSKDGMENWECFPADSSTQRHGGRLHSDLLAFLRSYLISLSLFFFKKKKIHKHMHNLKKKNWTHYCCINIAFFFFFNEIFKTINHT